MKAAKIVHRENVANTEAMAKIIQGHSDKNSINPELLSQLMSSLKTLRNKEKKARTAVYNMQEEINKRNEVALKNVVKNKSLKIKD